MSEKNIEMQVLNSSGGYDSLYPKTVGAQTIVGSGTCENLGIPTGSNVDIALSSLQTTKEVF